VIRDHKPRSDDDNKILDDWDKPSEATIGQDEAKRERNRKRTCSTNVVVDTCTDTKISLNSSSRDVFRVFDGSALVAIGKLVT
jgi:hypothetical protein